MRHLVPGLLVAACAVVTLAAPAPAAAMTQIRGTVVDAEGNPIPDVQIQLEYKGDVPGRSKITKVKTNKKGSWVRVGLPEGPYLIMFAKEGYATTGVQYTISTDGLAEVNDVVLEKLPAGEVAIAPSDLERMQAEQKKQEEQIAKLGNAYQDALAAIKATDWDTAETLLREVLQAVPDEPLVHFNLAVVLIRRHDPARNDLEGAEQELRRTIELEPSNGDALVALAAVLSDTDRAPEAVAMLESQNEDFRDDLAFQDMLGTVATKAGRSDLARSAFTKVLELDPANAQVHFHLAGMEISDGNLKAGIDHLNKVVELEPADSQLALDAKALIEALKGS